MAQKSEIAWCPGCGNFAIRDALEKALQELPIPRKDIVFTSGIGQAANRNIPLNPLLLALAIGAPFVARGFAGEQDHLKELITEAILFKGTAVVDILQPCVSFNRTNTFAWYKKKIFKLEKPLTDRYEAMKTAALWSDRIPIGTIYRDDKAECRTGKRIFRKKVKEADILSQLRLPCVMMR